MAVYYNSRQKDSSTSRGYFILLLLVLLSVFADYVAANSGQVVGEQDLAKVEWWMKTNFYQIYLRSFKDSDGDGNGDLRGVIEKIDYLRYIGAETIVMSPLGDGGHDIDSYVNIHPMFGTMADFDELISKLKARNMRLVIDLEPHHSSIQLNWVKQIARFWLQKGVDGLRVVSEWRNLCENEFDGEKKLIITDAHDDIQKLIEFYKNGPKDHLVDLSTNTQLFKLNEDNLRSNYIEELVMSWIKPVLELNRPREQGAVLPWLSWMVGNQDNSRIVNRIGRKNVFFLKSLMYFLPGVPFNYYGDELPLQDASSSQTAQQGIDDGEQDRLPFRAPMAWSRTLPSARFSSNASPWMPLNEDWQTNNVAYLSSSVSHPKNELLLFVGLQGLRRLHMSTFVFGDLVFFHNKGGDQQMLLAVARTHEKFGNLLMLTNLNPSDSIQVHLSPSESIIGHKPVEPPQKAWIVFSNRKDKSAPEINDGYSVEIDGLWLGPSQTVLFEYDSTSVGLTEETKKRGLWGKLKRRKN